MKQDLGELFQHGRAASATWTHERVDEALQALAVQSPGSRVDWEPGDEEWGRVVDTDGGVVGLVCARIPIGAARNDISRAGLPKFLIWIGFGSTNEPEFQVAPEILEEVFGRQVSRSINYRSLSLNDLWWATVS